MEVIIGVHTLQLLTTLEQVEIESSIPLVTVSFMATEAFECIVMYKFELYSGLNVAKY